MARDRHRSGAHRRHYRLVRRLHPFFPRRIRSRRPRRGSVAGISAVPPYPDRVGLRAGGHRNQRGDAVVDHRRGVACRASHQADQRRRHRLSCQSERHHDDGGGLDRADSLRRRGGDRGDLRRDLSRPRLRLHGRVRGAHLQQRHHRQFVLQIFLHDRLAHRLDGSAAVTGARRRKTAAEPCDFRADAVANRRRSRFRRARGAGNRATGL